MFEKHEPLAYPYLSGLHYDKKTKHSQVIYYQMILLSLIESSKIFKSHLSFGTSDLGRLTCKRRIKV